MKKATKAIIAAAAAGSVFLAAGEVMYRLALDSEAIKKMPKFIGDNDELTKCFMTSELVLESTQWYKEMPKEHWEAHSPRGETLHADVIFSDEPSDVWVISIHGYTAKPSSNAPQNRFFHSLGFNLLMPSLCGHADSECKYVAMGWHDRLDICEWISVICSKNPKAKIVLYGVSMGAATVMMTTGEPLPDNVRCAVEDCGYSSVEDEFNTQVKDSFHLPRFPFIRATDVMTRIHAGYSFKEASSVEQLKKSKTPTLFIHGEEDSFVPYSMLDKCYDAAACEKEKFSVPGAQHAASAITAPEEYFAQVKAFIEKYI